MSKILILGAMFIMLLLSGSLFGVQAECNGFPPPASSSICGSGAADKDKMNEQQKATIFQGPCKEDLSNGFWYDMG